METHKWWQQTVVLAKKDILAVLPLVAGSWLGWLGCVIIAMVLPRIGLSSESALAFSFVLTVVCGYLGIIKGSILDDPWDSRTFAFGKPVAPAFTFVAKAGGLFMVFLLPVLVAPRFGPMVGADLKMVLACGAMMLFVMVSAVLVRNGLLTFGLHLGLFAGMASAATNRVMPKMRWGELTALTLLIVGLATTLLLVVQVRRRIAALVMGTALLGLTLAVVFRLRHF